MGKPGPTFTFEKQALKQNQFMCVACSKFLQNKLGSLETSTFWSIEIVPRGGPTLKMGGPPLELINIQPKKGGSASRIHQPKGGSASRFHQPDGGPPLDFINQMGSASGIQQHQPKNGGPPLGTISMDLAVLALIPNIFDSSWYSQSKVDSVKIWCLALICNRKWI